MLVLKRASLCRNFSTCGQRWASQVDLGRDNNNNDDNDSQIFDSKWIRDARLTPYSIFGLTESARIDRKQLKKKYHEFAKLYHPDTSNGLRITDSHSSGDFISQDEKLQRFRIVTNAYEILNDDNKKRLYDHTRSGWPYGRSDIRNNSNPHGYKSNATYAYYNAGTWEDLNDLNARDKPKFDPGTLAIWVCGLIVCFELTSLLSRLEDTIVGKNFVTQEQTENDLIQSRINYGLETDKFTRLRRFLWFRTFGLYRSREDLDREAIKNEQYIQNLKNKEKRKPE